MRKVIALDSDEVELLESVLDYITCDGKEETDFCEQMGVYTIDSDNYFNEHGVLQCELVPPRFRSHIYYKVEKLRQALIEVTYA